MRFLILGGTRFIGPAVVRLLAVQGHTVAVFHRGDSQAELPSDIVRIFGDRRSLANFRAEFVRFAPDVVIDTFAMTERDGQDVMQVFAGVARRVVVLSSMDVYRAYDRFRGVDPGEPELRALTEDAPLRDRLFPYQSQTKDEDDLLFHYEKILVERAVLGQADLPATVLRLPCVYGPGDYQHRAFEYLKRMDDGRSTILLGRLRAAWRWTRGYVEDVAASVVLAATDERAAGQVFNVGEPEGLTEEQWVRKIGQAAGWTGNVRVVPDEQLPEHLRTAFDWRQHIVGHTSKIRRVLGYREHVAGDEAMAGTVAWERGHPPAQVDSKQFDYVAEDLVVSRGGGSEGGCG